MEPDQERPFALEAGVNATVISCVLMSRFKARKPKRLRSVKLSSHFFLIPLPLTAQDLLHRGVSADLVDTALQSFFGEEQRVLRVSQPETDDEDAQGSSLYNQHDALGDQLLEAVRIKQKPMLHLPAETQRRRLAGFIQRRGHSWDTAKQILRQLNLLS